MRTSLASGVALSVPTFFSGLIRAHGGGGGGGGETTTDPWGTTECTDQTTYDTTWATTQETTLPETTVDTTAAPQRPRFVRYSLTLFVAQLPSGVGWRLAKDAVEAHIFDEAPPPWAIEPNPNIELPDLDPENREDIPPPPKVDNMVGAKIDLNDWDEGFTNTTTALKDGFPKYENVKVEPQGHHAGGENWRQCFNFKADLVWQYEQESQ